MFAIRTGKEFAPIYVGERLNQILKKNAPMGASSTSLLREFFRNMELPYCFSLPDQVPDHHRNLEAR
jgi:hypothetical protein